MKKRNLTRFLSPVLALTMTASLAAPAMAVGSGNGNLTTDPGQYYYEAPTAPMSTDDNVVTASAHRAASPLLGILGVDAVSGFGMIQGSAPSDLASAQQAPAVGIWGSSINENPDPYYWNYFYNFYAAENGLETVENALVNDNVAASPGQADSTLKEEYGNVSVSLSKRPDILIGCATKDSNEPTGYNDQIATINGFTSDSPYYQEGDETYSPIQVGYNMSTIQDMIESVYAAAEAIQQVEAATGKTTRYGDVMTIAQDYETYVKGTIAYVLEELDAKGLEQKTVAVLTGYDAATGMYTLANADSQAATSSNRPYQYVMNVSKNLSDEIGSTTISAADLCAKADAIVCFNGTIENAGDGTSSISQDSILESFGETTYDGILCATQPTTLYGMTMNSVENAMGYAYTIAYIYSDILDLDPVEMCAYFYQHFLHVTSADGLATVVRNNLETTILPEGSSTTLSSTYSEAAIQAKLAKGLDYYAANPSKFTDAEFDTCGMRVTEDQADQDENQVEEGPVTVQPTAQALTVDGQAVTGVEVYAIIPANAVNGNNYFKLRDVAALLNGTDAQFSVDYDSATNTIVIVTGQPYTSDGSELSGGSAVSVTAQRTSQALTINGETVNDLSIYAITHDGSINGNNYFKLRDLGDKLGFGVDYDAQTNSVVVTSK
jgi:hypothetical protein